MLVPFMPRAVCLAETNIIEMRKIKLVPEKLSIVFHLELMTRLTLLPSTYVKIIGCQLRTVDANKYI